MPSIRLPESIGTLTKQGSTTVQLAASRLNIGGMQYATVSPITLSINASGLNGLDASKQAWKLYYVYAVISSGAIGLVGSTSSTGPSGYSASRLVGYFDTNGSSDINGASRDQTGRVGDWKSAHMTEAQFLAENGPGWILADGRSVSGSIWATLTSTSNAPDARGVVLRGKNNGRADGSQNPDGDSSLGAFQSDEVKAHKHTAPGRNDFGIGPGSSNPLIGSASANTTVDLLNNYGGNETRMKNITVNHFLKVN